MKDSEEEKKSIEKVMLGENDNDNQIIFRFLGIEMTAPKGLKNPRLIYISFILVNLILLILLKNIIMN